MPCGSSRLPRTFFCCFVFVLVLILIFFIVLGFCRNRTDRFGCTRCYFSTLRMEKNKMLRIIFHPIFIRRSNFTLFTSAVFCDLSVSLLVSLLESFFDVSLAVSLFVSLTIFGDFPAVDSSSG